MSKKLQLSIAEPCHENWDDMSPVATGKFCGSCQKQVVDFSTMSDRQVAGFFKKPSTGSVCGRFMSDQLERDIEIPRKRIPWVKYFFQIVIPAFLVSIKASSQTTKGKIKVSTVSKDTTRRPVNSDYRTMGMVARPDNLRPFVKDTVVNPVNEPVTFLQGEIDVVTPSKEPVCTVPIMGKIAMPATKQAKVEGIVVDEKGRPLPFASVVIKGTRNGMAADQDGKFSIKTEAGWDKITLAGSCVGFKTSEIVVDRKKYNKGLVIKLETAVMGEQEVMVMMMGAVARTKPHSGKNVKPIPLIADLPPASRSFNVFPNPAVTGEHLTIEWKEKEEGYYSIQLVNLASQSVYQQEVWIDREARSLDIALPFVAPGSYLLVLTNKKSGKKLTEKIIIQ